MSGSSPRCALAPKTSYDLRRMGCYQCPARIIELRRAGFNIFTERVTLYDAEGYAHPNAARYHHRSRLGARDSLANDARGEVLRDRTRFGAIAAVDPIRLARRIEGLAED